MVPIADATTPTASDDKILIMLITSSRVETITICIHESGSIAAIIAEKIFAIKKLQFQTANAKT